MTELGLKPVGKERTADGPGQPPCLLALARHSRRYPPLRSSPDASFCVQPTATRSARPASRTCSAARLIASAEPVVDVAPVADLHDGDDALLVADLVGDAVLPDTQFRQAPKRAAQGLGAGRARVIRQGLDALDDAPLHLCGKAVEVAIRGPLEPHLIAHSPSRSLT